MDEERESLGVQPAVDLIPESDPVQQELQDDGFVEEMLNLPATQATAVPAPTAVKKSAPRRKNVVRNEARGTGKGDDLEIVRDDLSVAARLPVGRIKNIMKMDPQARNMAGDSVYLMCKAAELFIEQVAQQSWYFTEAASRKTMSSNDVHLAVDSQDNLRFLEDMLP